MNKIYKNYIVLSGILLLWATGCNNDFMDRFPSTEISPEAYFKTVKDLELYTNTYYANVTPYFLDYVSDNYASFAEVHSNNNLIRGAVSAETAGGWSDWGKLRTYNFFLENVHKVSGDPADIAHYTGLTRLQRCLIRMKSCFIKGVIRVYWSWILLWLIWIMRWKIYRKIWDIGLSSVNGMHWLCRLGFVYMRVLSENIMMN